MIPDNELITMGLNLGVYTIAKLFSEGVASSPEGWRFLAEHCAKQLEEQTGLPAEDLALSVQPTVDEMVKKMEGLA